MSHHRLEGKRAVITGGTTGLGLAAAERYLAEGAQVLISGRSAENVDVAVGRLGERATGVSADSTSMAGLEQLFEAARDRLGQVDILLVNAGSLADAKKRKPLMNGVAHNPYQVVDRTEAYAVRNELLPILRHFIETEKVV
ncbi:MAG: SDR family NAD(P)-dependent oxidoreductase [Allosphingosinicella sp.]|uniref:SDR family NAD(P)-dependent oxidoreductase n=1 Tax=Allosphingosinicella sp. TaxID=2823234 RepID=UPI00391FFABF